MHDHQTLYQPWYIPRPLSPYLGIGPTSLLLYHSFFTHQLEKPCQINQAGHCPAWNLSTASGTLNTCSACCGLAPVSPSLAELHHTPDLPPASGSLHMKICSLDLSINRENFPTPTSLFKPPLPFLSLPFGFSIATGYCFCFPLENLVGR